MAVVERTALVDAKMIYVVRNQQVMPDNDLAMLYQVETKRLNEAVKRNILRFPERFRFQLTKDERKLILDRETACHVGASLKDAGKKYCRDWNWKWRNEFDTLLRRNIDFSKCSA